MRKLIMWNLITLDGYFEGETPWELPWVDRVWGKELEQFSLAQLQSADMLLFGRLTYEGMAQYWQTAEGEIAEYMNRLPKFVASRTLRTVKWENTTLMGDSVVETITRLKQEGNGNMFVFGSATFSQTLIDNKLFDEYRICILPVLFGNGRSLFKSNQQIQGLRLIEVRPHSTGCVILRYQTEPAS